MDTVTQDAPQDTTALETEPTSIESPAKETEVDPYTLDETQFASLSPEQRAALDPVLGKWKETAKTVLEKERAKERKSFEKHVKQSQALENLTKDARFQKWYQEQLAASRPEAKAQPQVASAQEWAEALQSMANGDATAWNALQQKTFQAWAAPTVQQVSERMNYLQADAELTKMLSNHPDAKELDQIGREGDPSNPSLLELCLHLVKDKNGGTMEQAYQVAKQVSLSMENRGKRTAMGLVKDKKDSTTEKPSTNTKEEGVILVDTMEEAMTANIEAAMDGRKVKYAVRKK